MAKPSERAVPGGAGRRPRGSLSRPQIVAAALDVARTEGLAAVSMPRLAQELGCGAMSLYGHVDSKEHLLELLAGAVLEDFPLERGDDAPWRPALADFAASLRRRMLEHRALAELLITRRMWSAGLAEVFEWLLGRMTEGGWPLRDGVRAYHSVQTYTLGFVLYEIGRTTPEGQEDHRAWWRHTLADLPPASFPRLHAAAGYAPEGAQDEQFTWGLERLLDGLAAELAHGGDRTGDVAGGTAGAGRAGRAGGAGGDAQRRRTGAISPGPPP
ncbi:TetR family transcriptional regulator [Streptomyces sp. 3211.6]|uniref:TetR/AcrR family transcriptional regulator n=1 Tax=Streptomyces sp. 3211.6 TaxID=1938845 RepID=UPI000F2AA6AA|nr:TetR/AcrR family transcriptional regulator [Streptomyces sp. 3211.6]RKT07842.1 TetR family transcriptional regulator [Streptomyces sp. 3211.6]